MRVETKQDGFGAALPGRAQSAPNKGRSSAGRDANDDVALGDAPVIDGRCARRRTVFGAFDGFPNGGLAAGQDALDVVSRNAEGGRTLGGVEDAEASARARAHVK